MTSLDDRLVPRTRALIEKYGLNASFSGYSEPTYDFATGTGAKVGAPVTVKITPPMPYEAMQIDRDLIQQGDARTYIAAQGLSFTPKYGMIMTLNGLVWRVVSVGEIRTGEQIALYELQLRK